MCAVTCLQILSKSSSCYSMIRYHQYCFLEASEGFSGVGAAAAWHKALTDDLVSLEAGLDAISSMQVMQGGTGFIPDIM